MFCQLMDIARYQLLGKSNIFLINPKRIQFIITLLSVLFFHLHVPIPILCFNYDGNPNEENLEQKIKQ